MSKTESNNPHSYVGWCDMSDEIYCAPPVNHHDLISLKATQQDLVKALLTLRELHAENHEELSVIDTALASANVYPWKLD